MKVLTSLTFAINGEDGEMHRHNVERLMGRYRALNIGNWSVGPFRWSCFGTGHNEGNYGMFSFENGVVEVCFDIQDSPDNLFTSYLCAFAEDAKYCGFKVTIIDGPDDPSYKGLLTSRDRLNNADPSREAIAFFAMVDGLMVRKGMQVSL